MLDLSGRVVKHVCRECNIAKPPEDFSWRNKKKGIRNTMCKECKNAYNKKHYKEKPHIYADSRDKRRSAELAKVNALKESTPCADCNNCFHYCQMQFDHLPGFTKEGTVSLFFRNLRFKEGWKEIKKCELVCTNCHAARTQSRQYINTESRRPSREKRRKYVTKLKESTSCMDCNEYNKFYAVHFDHRPGVDKLGTVSDIMRKGPMKKLKEEIAKCDLVCGNCHAYRTWKRINKGSSSKSSAIFLD